MLIPDFTHLTIRKEEIKFTQIRRKYVDRIRVLNKLGRPYWKWVVTSVEKHKVPRTCYRNIFTGRFVSKEAYEADALAELLPQVFSEDPNTFNTSYTMDITDIDLYWEMKEEIREWEWEKGFVPTTYKEWEKEMEWFDLHKDMEAKHFEVAEDIIKVLAEEPVIVVAEEPPKARVVSQLAVMQARIKLFMRKGMNRTEAVKEVMR